MFKGSIVALITPFKDDVVDTKALHELVEYHIAEGTHAIVAAGTTGESGTLSYEEKLLVIKTVIAAAKERLPIIAGTAANATKHCIELTRAAMDLGAHGALIMTPAYIKPTQLGLYEHYAHIAKEVAIPIILYNVPARTACDMQPETVAKLAKISNIVAIKEASGDMARLQSILSLTEHQLDVFSGDDPTCADWLLAGAKGVISVTANVVPRLMARLNDLSFDAHTKDVLTLQETLLPLHKILFCESNPIPVKWALHKTKQVSPELRRPLTELSEEHQKKIESVLDLLAQKESL